MTSSVFVGKEKAYYLGCEEGKLGDIGLHKSTFNNIGNSIQPLQASIGKNSPSIAAQVKLTA